jgi:hypothetical protein
MLLNPSNNRLVFGGCVEEATFLSAVTNWNGLGTHLLPFFSIGRYIFSLQKLPLLTLAATASRLAGRRSAHGRGYLQSEVFHWQQLTRVDTRLYEACDYRCCAAQIRRIPTMWKQVQHLRISKVRYDRSTTAFDQLQQA